MSPCLHKNEQWTIEINAWFVFREGNHVRDKSLQTPFFSEKHLFFFRKHSGNHILSLVTTKSPDSKMPGKKETADDGPIQRFCKKCNINYNLIMLKVTLFLMYGGKYTVSYRNTGKSISCYYRIMFPPVNYLPFSYVGVNSVLDHSHAKYWIVGRRNRNRLFSIALDYVFSSTRLRYTIQNTIVFFTSEYGSKNLNCTQHEFRIFGGQIWSVQTSFVHIVVVKRSFSPCTDINTSDGNSWNHTISVRHEASRIWESRCT